MTARERLLHRWEAQLIEVLPGMDPRRTRMLADVMMGLEWSGSVALGKIAASLPGPTRDPSRERAVSRWMKNPRVEVDAIWRVVRPALLASWAGHELTLTLDLTPQGTQWTVITLGVVTHGRALPIAGRVEPQQTEWETSLGAILAPMLADVASAARAVACPVTLVADQGLTGTTLIDQCQRLGWHWELRVNVGPNQANRIATDEHGEERLWTVVERLQRAGRTGATRARLFKAAGWRDGYLTVYRGVGMTAPWVLFSDRAGGYARVRGYRRRWSIEPMFQDSKGRGWNVEASRLREAARLERLLLALHLLFWWLFQLGARAIRHGERTGFERHHRRELSVIQLGRRVLRARLDCDQPPPLPFTRTQGRWRHVRYA